MDDHQRLARASYERKEKRIFRWPLIVILLLAIYCGWCLVRPLESLKVQAALPSPASSQSNPPILPWPEGSEGAIGTLQAGLLMSSTSHESPSPTASVAKLITALTVLDKYPLVTAGQKGQIITLSQADVNLYEEYYKKDGSLVQVAAGEKITEHQALEAMLIPSGNNMADSLAIWAYGSLQNYRQAAQQKVRSLGMLHTTIGTDASGYSETTTSTPSDLIKLGQAVLKNPALAQIVSQKSATVPVAGKVVNTNYLLGTSNIIGIKTGNSPEAGGCLLFAAKYNLDKSHQITIIGAIQHADNLLAVMKAATPLLIAAEHNFKLETPVKAGQTVAHFTASWLGDPVPILTKTGVTLPVWKSKDPELSLDVDSNNSLNQVAVNSTVGDLYVGYNNLQKKIGLVAGRAINSPSVFWRLTHPF